MPQIHPEIQRFLPAFDLLTGGIYFGLAVALACAAAISLVDVVTLIIAAIHSTERMVLVLQILHSLLLTIIILELLESITIYFRTSTFSIQPIILAGLTAMIRRLFMFGVEVQNPVDIAVTLAAIVVLTFALLLLKRDGQTEFPH